MKTSRFHLSTLKETPADAEIVSHQLMLRAGMIRRLASGLYTWLPLGLRVLRKVRYSPPSCGRNRDAGNNTAPSCCA